MRTLQATEGQLQALMERAETTNEVLRVQTELTSVRDRKERLQGQMQLLSQTAAESLITVALVPASFERPIVDDSWSLKHTLRSATRGLLAALLVIANIATWVVVLAPIWAPIAGLAWLSGRKGWLGGRPPCGAHGARVSSATPPPPSPAVPEP
jgi:hypothetical protein